MNNTSTRIRELYNQANLTKVSSEKDETLASVSIMIDSLLSIPNSVDPHSGHILPLRLSELCSEVYSRCKQVAYHHDRIYRLIKFLSKDIETIINLPRNRIERTHQMLPPNKAKSFDSRSLNWLCKRPGSNITEKLASVSHILCVKREFSINTSENRLFKEVLKILNNYLSIRQSIFEDKIDKEEAHLLSVISKWLRETSDYIGVWKNIPPNNVLLQDKHYRKIWDAWGIIKKLDNYLNYDFRNAKIYRQQIFLLCLIQSLIEIGVCFAEMPVILEPDKENKEGGFHFVIPEKIIGNLKVKNNYSSFFITHKNNLISLIIDNGKHVFCFRDSNQISFIGKIEEIKISEFEAFITKALKKLDLKKWKNNLIKEDKFCESESVTIDLYRSKLGWADSLDKNNSRDYSLIRQYWTEKNLGDTFKYYCSMPLSDSKAWFYSENVPTFSMNNLLWNNRKEVNENYSKIANDLTKDIARKFKSKKVTILLPDIQDDLNENTKSLRLALENSFLNSELSFLPTSIAAVFSVKNSWENIDSKTCYAVIEKYGNILTITPITTKKTKYYKDLKNKLKITNGFIFEHHQSIKKELSDNINIFNDIAGLANQPIFSDNQWNNPENNKEKEVVVTEDEIRKACPDNKTIKVLVVSHGVKVSSKFFIVEELAKKSSREIAKGGEILRNLEDAYPDHPIWTDDLPPLSVEVTDSNNNKVSIGLITSDHEPIITNGKKEILLTTREEKLFIPRNNKRPKFIIKRDIKGKTELFQAELILPYPYPKEVQCRLRLYYTYAAAEPYRLNFLLEDQNLSLNASIVSNKENPYKYSAPQLSNNANWEQIESKDISLLIKNLSIEWWEEFNTQFSNPEEYLDKNKRVLTFVGHGNHPIYFYLPNNNKSIPVRRRDFLNPRLFDKMCEPDFKCLCYIQKTYDSQIFFKIIHKPSEMLKQNKVRITDIVYGLDENNKKIKFYVAEMDNGQEVFIYSLDRLQYGSTYNVLISNVEVPIKLEEVILEQDTAPIIADMKNKDWPSQVCRKGRNINLYNIWGKEKKLVFLGIDRKQNLIVNRILDRQPHIFFSSVYDEKTMDKNTNEIYYDDRKKIDYAFSEKEEQIFVHFSQFLNTNEYKNRMEKNYYAVVEKDLATDSDRYRALGICTNEITLNDFELILKRKIKRFLNWHTNKVFKKGSVSPNLPNCPSILIDYLTYSGETLYKILVEKCKSKQLKYCLEEFLGYFGSLAPKNFSNYMKSQYIDEEFLDNHTYCLGTITEDWQKIIWGKIVSLWEKQDDYHYSLFNITYRTIRNKPEALEYFNYNSAKKYLEFLSNELEYNINNRKIKELKDNISAIFYCLLFRKSNYDSIRELLSSQSELSNKIYELIDKINSSKIAIKDLEEKIFIDGKEKSIINLLSDYLFGIKADEMITILDDSEDDDSDEDLD